jgi:hypothetical protein
MFSGPVGIQETGLFEVQNIFIPGRKWNRKYSHIQCPYQEKLGSEETTFLQGHELRSVVSESAILL